MKIDLKGLNRKELEKLKANVEKALARLSITDMKVARAAAEKAAKSHGFSLHDLIESPEAKKSASKKPAKVGKARYKNPADPKQTWTGKGRRPNWVVAAQDAGKSLDDLAI